MPDLENIQRKSTPAVGLIKTISYYYTDREFYDFKRNND